MPQSLPDPFYYLTNFRFVLDWVGRCHAGLLVAEEQAFLAGFPQLPKASQALLVRMVMRQGELFRASRLAYAEIGNVADAMGPLVTLGWVDAAPPLTLDMLAGLLRKDELARALGLPASLRKRELVEAARARCGDAEHAFAGWCPALDDTVYALRVGGLCDRLRLLFFGNLHQDWSEFVLADLGIYQYEPVALEAGGGVFRTREDVDAYLRLWQLRERLETGEPVTAIMADTPAQPCANPWLEARRARLLFRLAGQLEKQRDWPGALALYRDCAWPGARTRQVRMLERCGDSAAALALAESALLEPESEEEAQQLSRMMRRLRRLQGLPSPPAARPVLAEVTLLTLPEDPLQPVELLVRAHIDQPQAPAFYVENGLVNSLFGLLCWPAIFAPLPGAFFHPFQQGPADLHAPDFHARRAALFAACLDRLEDGSYRDAILATWREKAGRLSPFVFWGLLDETLLALALDCIPPVHLRLLFTRLLQDVQRNRSGFPDLIQFWPREKRYRMVEVKGPGDRVQDNQQRWLAYFAQHGLPAGVCHVQWAVP